jgi:hypothetical protein
MYKNICFGKIRFPKGVINEDGQQWCVLLLFFWYAHTEKAKDSGGPDPN